MEDRRELADRFTDAMIMLHELHVYNKRSKVHVHWKTLDDLRGKKYVEKHSSKLTPEGFDYLVKNGLIKNNIYAINKKKGNR